MDWLATILQTWLLVSLPVFGLLMSVLIAGARADRHCHDNADTRIAPSDGETPGAQTLALA